MTGALGTTGRRLRSCAPRRVGKTARFGMVHYHPTTTSRAWMCGLLLAAMYGSIFAKVQ